MRFHNVHLGGKKLPTTSSKNALHGKCPITIILRGCCVFCVHFTLFAFVLFIHLFNSVTRYSVYSVSMTTVLIHHCKYLIAKKTRMQSEIYSKHWQHSAAGHSADLTQTTTN